MVGGETPGVGKAFGIFYLIGFVVSFGVIILMLKRLHFGLASGVLFLFFLSSLTITVSPVLALSI